MLYCLLSTIAVSKQTVKPGGICKKAAVSETSLESNPGEKIVQSRCLLNMQ